MARVTSALGMAAPVNSGFEWDKPAR
jgi:hypothetical protein